MAAFDRPTEATYTIHDNMTVNTTDREDHTFCGIMFPLECKASLPIESLVITSLSIRGQLGPITVWVTKNDDEKASVMHSDSTNTATKDSSKTKYKENVLTADPSQWTKIYSKTLSPPSIYDIYNKLDLKNPIMLKPGQKRGIYIHSSLPNDKAIVYDNFHHLVKSEVSEDSFIRIHPAMAHLSFQPFGRRPIWGHGEAWRYHRKFVGKIDYGVVYKLWNPKEHLNFGRNFQMLAMLLFACQRRSESPISRLPDDCIFYILNMCKWDWVGDGKHTTCCKNEKKKNQKSEKGLRALIRGLRGYF